MRIIRDDCVYKAGIAWNFHGGYLEVDFNMKGTAGACGTRNVLDTGCELYCCQQLHVFIFAHL